MTSVDEHGPSATPALRPPHPQHPARADALPAGAPVPPSPAAGTAPEPDGSPGQVIPPAAGVTEVIAPAPAGVGEPSMRPGSPAVPNVPSGAGTGRRSRHRGDRWTAGAARAIQDGRGPGPDRRLTHPGRSRGDDLRDSGGGRDDLPRGTVRFQRGPRGGGRRTGCTCRRRVGPRRVLRMGRTQGRRCRGPVLVHAGHPLVLLETIPTDATAQERPREPCAAAAAGSCRGGAPR